MSRTATGAQNFITGLSDMWTLFFRERPTLEALYEGAQIPVGQAYLDLVGTALRWSIRNIPTNLTEYFKLITVREDQLTQRSDNKYEIEVTDLGIKGVPFLQNKIYAPTAILTEHADYEIISNDKDRLVFTTNPFDPEPLPGFAYRWVEVVNDDGETVSVRELSFWGVDVVVDNYDMFLNFGYLIDHFEPSSEAYRALLTGVIRYFVLGPTDQHLTSALNVLVGLAVVRDDDEQLVRVDNVYQDAVLIARKIVTSSTTYEFDAAIPLREDILDQANWGTLTFRAFEPLTLVFVVKDAISDPTWWYGKTIPSKILPGEPLERRKIWPDPVLNLFGMPANNQAKFGDPGVFYGADSDGYVPAVDGDHPTPYAAGGDPTLWRPTYRHRYAYVVFERFLKAQGFYVDIDSTVLQSGVLPFDRLITDIDQVILAGKSAYVYQYYEPGLEFEDRVKVDPDDATKLGVHIETLRPTEGLVPVSNEAVFGDGDLAYGDVYKYDGAGGVTITNEAISFPNMDGKTPVIFGGADPHKLPTQPTPPGPTERNGLYADWPVQITLVSAV